MDDVGGGKTQIKSFWTTYAVFTIDSNSFFYNRFLLYGDYPFHNRYVDMDDKGGGKTKIKSFWLTLYLQKVPIFVLQ